MTDITAVLSEYQTFTAKIIEQRNKLGEEIGKSFHGLFTEFFQKFPEIAYVTWTQYTPYFNDGDECTFRVGERHYPLNALVKDEQPVGYSAEEYALSHYDDRSNQNAAAISDERASEIYDGITALESILDSIPEDIYKDVFNDHVYVIVTREGISTDEYDHE